MIVLLLITVDRSPAPISEVETPTPAPEQSAKRKPKRTVKPETGSENSRNATKPTSPSAPKTHATPSQGAFQGTWVGRLNGLPLNGDVDYTLVINAAGTVVNERSTAFGSLTWPATCDGVTMRWKSGAGCAWTLTPNSDGKTALMTVNCPGVFGIGAYNSSSTLRKTSP